MEAAERASTAYQRRPKVGLNPPFLLLFAQLTNLQSFADMPKRTFSQMASPGESSQDDEYVSLDDLMSSRTLSPSPRLSMTPPINSQNTSNSSMDNEDGSGDDGRRVRRGLDFRRPVFSTAPHNSAPVIDLTSDTSDNEAPEVTAASRRPSISGRQAQRLPRFAREIIDIDDDEPPAQPPERPPESTRRLSSPDIEIIETRQLPPRTQLRQPTPTLLRQDAQEVTFLETRRLPSPISQITRTRRRLPTPHVLARGRHGQIARVDRHHRGRMHEGFPGMDGIQHFFNRVQVQLGMDVGIDLNFETVGFDLGMMRDAPARPPAYEPPTQVPEGFTRSPKEDEVLVCPNCGDELCEGSTKQKRQIWVVKKCGHVSIPSTKP